MDTTTSTLLAGTLVIVGRWAQGKPINVRIIIGLIGSAIFLSLIAEADDKLARNFGAMVLLTALFVYGVPVLQKTGLIK